MKYQQFKDAQPFDPDDPLDAIAETARKAVVAGFLPIFDGDTPRTGQELQYVASGALVGLLGVLMCAVKPEDHRELLAEISNLTPWAANQARSIMELPPLVDQ